MAKSVLELSEQAMRYGCAFVRDPWTGAAVLLRRNRAPAALLDALENRWDDVEAILAEQSPPSSVALLHAERMLMSAR
jgi:hypothetical protein